MNCRLFTLLRPKCNPDMAGYIWQAAAIAAVVTLSVAQPVLVPLPASVTVGDSVLELGGDFSIRCGSSSCGEAEVAFSRYKALIFSAGVPTASGANNLPGLDVFVANVVSLGLGVDESYNLTVPVNGDAAVLSSVTQWGALRGLETFSQLVQWSKDYSGASNGTYSLPYAPVAITDSPRWIWRGMLLDTSRHYQPLTNILLILEAMSYNKLNVLHLHVVDDQSWPLVSTTYTNFSAQGAWAPDAVYTHSDVQAVVSFAHARGILVVPEFDLPAHGAIWGKGYPQLAVPCPGGETLLNPIPSSSPSFPVPGAPDLYTMVGRLLDEFLPILGTPPFVHLGGDEVFNTTCWQESPAVQAWAVEMGWDSTDMHSVRQYLESRMEGVLAARGVDAVFWEEVWNLGFNISSSSVVNAWLNTTDIAPVLASGRRVISAYGLYLNRAQPQAPLVPVHYAFQDTWQDFWRLDPLEGVSTSLPLHNFLGQTISQWGIQYAAANVLTDMWPRSCGAAERSWSPPSSYNAAALADATRRIEGHACRMVQRGVPSGPLGAGYCPTAGEPGVPPTPGWLPSVLARGKGEEL